MGGDRISGCGDGGERRGRAGEGRAVCPGRGDVGHQHAFYGRSDILPEAAGTDARYQNCLFSGYDEFEYAKEAIKLEAEEYILKPIDAQELQEVFVRIRKSLDEELDRRRNVDRLKKYYQESLPTLRDQLLIGILEGRISDLDRLKHYTEAYGLGLSSGFYMVGVIYTDEQQDNGSTDTGLLAVSLKQLIDEQLEKKLEFYSVNYLGSIVVLALLHETVAAQNFVALMDRNCRRAKKMLGTDTVAGIGKVYGQISHIHDSYEEAKEAAAYRILLDANQAIYIQDVEPESGAQPFHEEEWIKGIIREIKIGTQEELQEEVRALTDRLKEITVTRGQLQLFLQRSRLNLSGFPETIS